MAGLKLQVYQEAYTRRARRKKANFDCTQLEDGSWRVHFWADHVESQDFVFSDGDVWFEINVIRERWRSHIFNEVP